MGPLASRSNPVLSFQNNKKKGFEITSNVFRQIKEGYSHGHGRVFKHSLSQWAVIIDKSINNHPPSFICPVFPSFLKNRRLWQLRNFFSYFVQTSILKKSFKKMKRGSVCKHIHLSIPAEKDRAEKTNWSKSSLTSDYSCNSETRSHYQTRVCDRSHRKLGSWLIGGGVGKSATAIQIHKNKTAWSEYQIHAYLCGSSSAGFSPSIHWGMFLQQPGWRLPPPSMWTVHMHAACGVNTNGWFGILAAVNGSHYTT